MKKQNTYLLLLLFSILTSYNLQAQFTQVSGTTTETSCFGTFVDAGEKNSTNTLTISPTLADRIKINFTFLAIDNPGSLKIIDGASTTTLNSSSNAPVEYISNNNSIQLEYLCKDINEAIGDEFLGTWQGILNINSATITDVECRGSATGEIQMVVTGTNPVASWTGPTTPANPLPKLTITNLLAGNYKAQITDDNGCKADTTLTISQPASVLSATISQLKPTCYHEATGQAKVIATGGTAPYTYNWDSGSVEDTAHGLDNTLYTCTITDNNSCFITKSINIAENNQITVATVDSSNYNNWGVSCKNSKDGWLDITPTGGTAPYSYQWGINTGNQSTKKAINLGAGTFNLTITDNYGCTLATTDNLSSPENIAISETITHATYYGASNGSINILVSDTAGTSTIAWSGTGTIFNQTSQSNLSAGLYSVTVTDGNGCSTIESYTVNQPSLLNAGAIEINGTTEQIVCKNDDTFVFDQSTPASGGSNTYTYSWEISTDNVNWNPIPGANASTYTLVNTITQNTYIHRITDDGATSKTSNTLLLKLSTLSSAISEIKPTCFELSSGQAEITASGGATPYQFTWTSGSNTNIAMGLDNIKYYCTVKDNDNCEVIDSITLSENPEITLSSTNSSYNSYGISCFGENDGWIKVTPTGGTGPYTYAWNANAGNQTTPKAENLPTGTNYSVVVTDAIGCTATSGNYSLSEPNTINIIETISHVSTYNGNDGKIQISVPDTSGTTSLYWSGYNTVYNSGTQNNLKAGNYSVTVVDGNNCSASETYTINQPASALSGGEIRYNNNNQDYACYSTTEFQFDNFTGYSGGNTDSSYTYSWQYSTNLSLWNNIPGTNTDNYKWPAALTQDMYFRRKVTNAGASAYSDTIYLNFLAKPTLSISNLKSEYCYNADTVTLIGSPLSTYGEFIGNGIILPNNSGVAMFLPGNADTTASSLITITYHYDEHGCITDLPKTTRIRPVPEPDFVLPSKISKSTATYVITGQTPSSGVFSGNGVRSDGVIFTENLIAGTTKVTYTANNTYNCTNFIQKTTEIVEGTGFFGIAATGTTEIDEIYCFDGEPVTIYARPSYNNMSGSFEAPITDNGIQVGILDPSDFTGSSNNSYIIKYNYSGVEGSFTIEKEIKVYNFNGQAQINNLAPVYCNYGQTVSISANPLLNGDQGLFSGIGVSNTGSAQATFNITDASSASPVTVQYVYTHDYSGCTDTTRVNVAITPKSNINFDSKSLFNKEGAIYKFQNIQPYGGTFSGSLAVSSEDSTFNPTNAKLGDNIVNYFYEYGNSCIDTASKTLIVENAKGSIFSENIYCYDGIPDTIFYQPATGDIDASSYQAVEFSIDGTSLATNDTAILDPSTLTPRQNHTIKYSYYGKDGITLFWITKSIYIDDIGNLGIDIPKLSYCALESADTIYGLRDGVVANSGIFSGAGIVQHDIATSGAATFNPAIAGNKVITYTYYSKYTGSSCSGIATKNITVHPKPTLVFEIPTVYNYNGPNDTLSAQPDGGIYSPLNYFISDTVFVPKKAGLGNKTLSYTYTDNNGCTNVSSKNTDVQQSTAVFMNLSDTYCYTDDDYTIAVSNIDNPADAIGTFSGYGITNLGNNQAIFNPKIAFDTMRYYNPGIDSTLSILVSFEYLGTNNSTTFSISKTIKIRNNGTVTISTFKKTDSFCKNIGTIDLNATPLHGIFSGIGVVGNTFNPALVSGDNTIITYSYTDEEIGCTIEKQNEVTILPLPEPTINFHPKICMDAGTQLIVGQPRGGELFSTFIPLTPISGFSDSASYSPGSNLVGTKKIQYKYTDPINFCTDTIFASIVIDTLPVVGIEIIQPAKGFCKVDENNIIQGLVEGNNANSGLFKGPGIVDTLLNTGKNQFNPILVSGDGIQVLTFLYTDANGCKNQSMVDVKVNNLPDVTFNNLQDAVCANYGDLLIDCSPKSGTNFISINNTTFQGATKTIAIEDYANSNALDTISIIFTNTDLNECTQSVSDTVWVNYTPELNFDISNLCIADSIRLLYQGNTNPNDIDSIRWKIDDDIFFYNTLNPNHLFTTNGKTNIELYMELNNGCSDISSRSFTLENNPKADFTWKKECINDVSTTFIPKLEQINSDYYKFKWEFGDGASDTLPNVSHKYANVGKYSIKFIINSNSSNCSDTAIKDIHIRPTYLMANEKRYQQSFEEETDGWIPQTLTNDTIGYSWAWGIPAGKKINSTPYGQKVYVTNLDSNYYNYENSAITSPCFDFTNYKRPMISLSLFKQMENDKDGAVLEYTTDYGETWKRVGNEDEGIEWYNSNNVNANPGAGGTRGWTDTTSQWVEARHDLDFLSNKENVQFRIAFKADNSINYEGLAIDNIEIGTRTRTVLVEHFTNYENSKARSSDQKINSITTRLINDAIDIQYQSSYSNNNSIFQEYQMGVTTRESFYGITAIPFTYFDGVHAFNFASASSTPDTISLMSRALTDPAFKIDLHTSNDGSKIDAQISIEALKELNNRQLTILTAVVEKDISFDPGTGELILENVLRRFIPGPGGEYLDNNWSVGQNTTLNYSINLPPYFEKGDSAIIITFIQDEISKEVLQAATDGATGLSSQTSIEDWFAGTQGLNLLLFPNPAGDNLYLAFSELPKNKSQVSILNQQGQIVSIFEPEAAWYSNCNIASLESGVYFVRWQNGPQQVVKKLIVQH